MDEMIEKIKKIKKVKILLVTIGPAILFLLIGAILMVVVEDMMNGIQSVDQNTTSVYNKGEVGNNPLFSTLCQNCDNGELNKNGVMGSEFYKKTSEMLNLYNTLELKKERDDDFDFSLLSATVQYGKNLSAELFTDSTNFGSYQTEQMLTNRDIDSFQSIRDIDNTNAQVFFKWAAVMLGTPYSISEINLRGLSGNLITGRITTTCGGEGSKTEDELIKQIIKVEKKFAGENFKQDTSFWNSILTFLGLSYEADEKLLYDRLKAMFDGDSKYEDLKTYVNMDNYDPNKCSNATFTYTKFMNYEQYRVYLRTVFIPQNYINCEKCVYRNGSEAYKLEKTEEILKDIFKRAEYYREYAGMTEFNYDNITYGVNIESNDLSKMSSPLKSQCEFQPGSGYQYRNGIMHAAVDVFSLGSDKSVYAIADGVVDSVNYYYTDTFPCTDTDCPCTLYEKDLRVNGINIIIRHEINGTTYFSYYNHLSKEGIEVKKGSTVEKGQKIANMGTTGCSSGVHLHFALYKDKMTSDINENAINPTALFNKCGNSNLSTELKLTTTDNFVTPEKCMIDKYTLDETITSIIKNMDSSLSEQKEAVKASAIVIRTALMNDSNWCNNKSKLNYNVNVDIENNTSDLNFYNQVIETQGMVLNYSGETLDNVKYTTLQCEILPYPDWMDHQEEVFKKIPRYVDSNGNLDVKRIDNAIEAYNEGCVSYGRSNPARIKLYTINDKVWEGIKRNSTGFSAPSDGQVTFSPQREESGWVQFSIPREWTTNTTWAKDNQNRFSTTIAKYRASKGDDYTEILYQFYNAKAINKQDLTVAHGIVDISTAPGLIDAKKLVSEKLGNNVEGFIYGTTLSGSNMEPPASASELPAINKDLKNYIDNADAKASSEGGDTAKAKIASAAYWLVNNNYYKVQYGSSDLSQYNVDGWNQSWDKNTGLDSLGFVKWSLKQAGSSESIIQNPRKTSNNFTVEELINGGIKVGDIISRNETSENGTKTSNSHWAIVTEVTESYIKVAHAVNEQIDLTITTYHLGEQINYQNIY